MTDSPIKAIDEGLASLGTRFRSAFAKAATEQALRAEHAKFLGKKGELTAVLSLIVSPPRTDAQLRRNPLGIYVNGLSWSRELDLTEGAKKP